MIPENLTGLPAIGAIAILGVMSYYMMIQKDWLIKLLGACCAAVLILVVLGIDPAIIGQAILEASR